MNLEKLRDTSLITSMIFFLVMCFQWLRFDKQILEHDSFWVFLISFGIFWTIFVICDYKITIKQL